MSYCYYFWSKTEEVQLGKLQPASSLSFWLHSLGSKESGSLPYSGHLTKDFSECPDPYCLLYTPTSDRGKERASCGIIR